MRIHTKVLLSGLAAALLLSVAIGSASARRIEVSERNFYVIWTPLQFGEPVLFVQPVRCPVTLLGSFHSRTISKVCGQLVGYVNHASVGLPSSCAGGEATILTATLPWHIRYASFAGTLPRITRVRLQLINAAFRVHVSGVNANCLYVTSEAEPALGDVNVNETTGVVNNLEALNTARIRLHEGSEICPANGEFRNAGRVVAGTESSTTAITVRLVQ